MPKRHRGPYAPEFRRRLIELVRAGRTPESLAKEFEPTAQAIRNWVRQADLDAGKRDDGVTTDEREELARLRREVKTLREEREILKKYAAWSAQESNRTPPKRSGS
jgi:transposase